MAHLGPAPIVFIISYCPGPGAAPLAFGADPGQPPKIDFAGPLPTSCFIE